MSEGEFVDVRPDQRNPRRRERISTRSTDTFDTIDWLVKNVPNNNGKVGMMGTSYNGYYTLADLIRAHPALLAASPQAPMADLYRGDDAYHNGAFFLVANFSFYTDFPNRRIPLLRPRVTPSITGPTILISSIWRWVRWRTLTGFIYSTRIPIGPICTGTLPKTSFWKWQIFSAS